MVIVELLNLDFPVDLKLRTMPNSNGKVTSVVEATELRRRNGSFVKGTGNWLLRCRLFLRLVEADDLSS